MPKCIYNIHYMKMYICIYIHIYIYQYIHITYKYTHTHTRARAHTHTHTHTHTHIYIYIYIYKVFGTILVRNFRKLERILIKLYRQNMSLLFNQTCLNICIYI